MKSVEALNLKTPCFSFPQNWLSDSIIIVDHSYELFNIDYAGLCAINSPGT